MAEVLLKVGDGANYQDGDVLCAFNNRRIQAVHAAELCNPKHAQRLNGGLLMADSLAWYWMIESYQYRFVRISKTEVLRIDQHTGERERFGPKHIDVRQFLRRRRQNANHSIFSDGPRVIWFGGKVNTSAATTSRIWQHIEQRSPFKRQQTRFGLWPMGRLDIRHHLALRVDDLTEKQARSFTEPQFETDDNGAFVWELETGERGKSDNEETEPDTRPGWRLVKVAKRRRRIRWRELLGDLKRTETAVMDPSVEVGHTIEENGRTRYTSLTQRLQQHDRVRRKAQRR